jgi:hypothetical protein
MTTTLVKKTWGEREGVTIELLEKFTKSGDPRFGKVQSVWAYRGDCTETGDRRQRATMPEEAYEHYHWDTVACNGGVLVCVPRWKSSEEGDESVVLRAPYWWAMSEIAAAEPDPSLGVRLANAKEIADVVPETQALLSALPGLEYMRIAKVGFYTTARKGRTFDKAPQDVRFFRFAAGYGCVSIVRREGIPDENAR